MGVHDAAVSGDIRATLEALRDRLAEEVERVADEGFCPACKRGSSSVAPVAGQLTKVLQEIAALPKPAEGTPLDELARRRRAAGRPDASDPTRAGDGGKRR